MSVRKAAGTTFWLLFLFIGFSYLFPIIRNEFPYEILYLLEMFMHPQYYESGFSEVYQFVVNLAMCAAIIVGTIDVILNNRCHFNLLKSYNVIIVFAIAIVIVTTIPLISMYMFWGILQLTAIIGTYWTFRKFIHNNRYGGQKLIPFIKDIKNIGGSPMCHISDHYLVWGVSLLLLILYAVQVISFLVFLIKYWNMLM